MLERFVVIGSAMVLAALVLFLTLWSEPATPPAVRQTIDDPVDVSRLPGFDPDRPSGQIDPRGQVKKYRVNSVNSRGQLIELFGDTLTPLPDGVTEVTLPGARIHLEPTRVLDIRAQRGTIHAPDNQIRSGDFAGDVVLTLFDKRPGQPPDASGGPEGSALQVFLKDARFDLELGHLESDRQVRMSGPRVEFHGLGLDLTYNALRRRIDRLEVDRGQLLRFKSHAPSVERKDDAGSGGQASTQPADAPAGVFSVSGVDAAAIARTQPAAENGDAVLNATSLADDGQSPQYYRARFERRVRVRDQSTLIEADRLDVVFCLRDQVDATQAFNRGGAVRFSKLLSGSVVTAPVVNGLKLLPDDAVACGRVPQSVLVQLAALVWAQPQAAGGGGFQEKSLSLADTHRDVTITWEGRLLIEPEESPPIDMTGPDDILVQLVGRPVRMTTHRGEVILAASVDYLASEGRVRAIGSTVHPLEIQSDTTGLLRGQRLVIHQNLGTGQILGPGRLWTGSGVSKQVATTAKKTKDTPDGSTGDRSGRARGPGIAWRDRVDLSFHRGDVRADSGYAPGRIDAVKQAVFYGDVQVDHWRFGVRCDKLTAGFAVSGQDKQTLKTIDAAGHVRADAADQDPLSPPARIRSDRLTVELVQDVHGGVGPSQLVAVGGVEARQGSRSIRAGRIEVALAAEPAAAVGADSHGDGGVNGPDRQTASPPWGASESPASLPAVVGPPAPLGIDDSGSFAQAWPVRSQEANPSEAGAVVAPTKKLAGADTNRRSYAIQTMTAHDRVQIQLDDLDLQVSADRFVADMPADQIEILGVVDQQPARVTRGGSVLVGQQIVASQTGQTVHVSGPGTVTFDRVAHDPAGGDSDDPSGTQMTVAWTGAMHFDNRYGLAQFVGDVVTDAWAPREASQLSAQDLRLEFSEVAEVPSQQGVESKSGVALAKPVDAVADRQTPVRAIRTVTARQDVVFLSTRWSDPTRQQVETRMRVTGPLVSFDSVAEQIQVIGPGKMLTEDYRVRSARRQSDPNAASLFGVERTGQVRLTGRGATLMRWSGQLMLDAFYNDMRVDSSVQMIHRSLDSQLTVQMDCQRLVADLEATGGLGTWLAGRAPQPRIQAIYADQDVRVLSDGRTILTDHLEFTGFDQSILLRADPGQLTEIQEEGRPTALTAEQFRWDLLANRLEMLRPGPSRVPLE